MPDLPQGTVVGGYEIEELAGRGGMGVVYRAIQRALRRRVALKVISPELSAEPTIRRLFEGEALLAASIEHPNIVPIYEAGYESELLFMTMRFVTGEDLRGLIGRGRLSPDRAIELVSQAASALDAAHARGVVH